MTFRIPNEQLTTDGPYSISQTIRRLTPMEIAYAEFVLQMELTKVFNVTEFLLTQQSRSESGPAFSKNNEKISDISKFVSPVSKTESL